MDTRKSLESQALLGISPSWLDKKASPSCHGVLDGAGAFQDHA